LKKVDCTIELNVRFQITKGQLTAIFYLFNELRNSQPA